MDTKQIAGILEVDQARGVVYFHANETGTTKLRINGLDIPPDWETIDIMLSPEDSVSAVRDPMKLKGTPRRRQPYVPKKTDPDPKA